MKGFGFIQFFTDWLRKRRDTNNKRKINDIKKDWQNDDFKRKRLCNEGKNLKS